MHESKIWVVCGGSTKINHALLSQWQSCMSEDDRWLIENAIEDLPEANFIHNSLYGNSRSVLRHRIEDVAIYLFQVTLLRIIHRVFPDMPIIGYSLGEYAASTFPSASASKETARALYARGKYLDQSSPSALVFVNTDDVNSLLKKNFFLAISLTDRDFVLGSSTWNEQVEKMLKSNCNAVKKLSNHCANHTSLIADLSRRFGSYLSEHSRLASGEQLIFSGVEGRVVRADQIDNSYWSSHLSSAIDLKPAIDLLRENAKLILDIGPSSSITEFVEGSLSTVYDLNFLNARDYACAKARLIAAAWESGAIDDLRQEPTTPVGRIPHATLDLNEGEDGCEWIHNIYHSFWEPIRSDEISREYGGGFHLIRLDLSSHIFSQHEERQEFFNRLTGKCDIISHKRVTVVNIVSPRTSPNILDIVSGYLSAALQEGVGDETFVILTKRPLSENKIEKLIIASKHNSNGTCLHELRYDNDVLYRRSFSLHHPDTAACSRLPNKLIILGGLGEIGWAILENLNAGCEVTVTSTVSEKQLIGIKRKRFNLLRQKFQHLKFAKLNIFDEVETEEFISSVQHRFPLVINCIGTTDPTILTDFVSLDAEDLERRTTGKLTLAKFVQTLTDRKIADNIICISSLSAVSGGIGLSAYAMANGIYNALASTDSDISVYMLAIDSWKGTSNLGEFSRGPIRQGVSPKLLLHRMARLLTTGKCATIYLSSDSPAARRESAIRATRVPPKVRSESACSAVTGKITPTQVVELLSKYAKVPLSTTTSMNATGINSLAALRFVRELTLDFGVTFSLETFYRANSVNDLIEAACLSKPEERLDQYPQASHSLSALELRWFDFLQHRLGFLFIGAAFNGCYSTDSLRQSALALFRRHANLRARFDVSERNAQVTFIEAEKLEFSVETLPTACSRVLSLARHDFDKAVPRDDAAPRYRILVTDNRFFFLGSIHHAFFDGWSVEILVRSLLEILRLGTLSFEETKPKVKHRKPRSEKFSEQSYIASLSGKSLCNFRPRELVDIKSSKTNTLSFRVAEIECERLVLLCRKARSSISSVILASYFSSLAAALKVTSLAIGTTLRGRTEACDFDEIGCFVNPLPIHINVHADFEKNVNVIDEHLTRIAQIQGRSFAEINEKGRILRQYTGNNSFDTYFLFNRRMTSSEIEVVEDDDLYSPLRPLWRRPTYSLRPLELIVFYSPGDISVNISWDQSIVSSKIVSIIFRDIKKIFTDGFEL